MGKLEGKVAVITGATSGMALTTANLFVAEGAYVFITERRQAPLDAAVKAIGRNVTGVPGDAGNLADLDRLYDTVRREKGRIDVLFASTGVGDLPVLTMGDRYGERKLTSEGSVHGPSLLVRHPASARSSRAR